MSLLITDLVDLSAADAVQRAAEVGAWSLLSDRLLPDVLAWLQDRDGDGPALADALADACRAARKADELHHASMWRGWLALHLAAEGPSAATDLDALAASPRMAEILDALHRLGRVERQSELAKTLALDPGELSRQLARLESAQLIARRPVGRTKSVRLTARGQRLVSKLPGSEVTTVDLAPVIRPWGTTAYEPVDGLQRV